MRRDAELAEHVLSVWLRVVESRLRGHVHYTVSGFDSIWRRLVQRSGLKDVPFHDIRAKALTDAKRDGGLDYAQALAGHESRNTTGGYVKARDVERV